MNSRHGGGRKDLILQLPSPDGLVPRREPRPKDLRRFTAVWRMVPLDNPQWECRNANACEAKLTFKMA
jgi:hypothetical protein